MTTVWPGAVDSYTTKVDNVTDVLAAHINNPQDAIVALETPLRDMSLMRVKNTSGSTVAANDVGYTDEAGEFKLNTTDFFDANWAVVVDGGVNNADIIVTNKGLVTVVCNGNVSAGQFLYLSTTTKQVQPQSYMRPEMLAVAKTANAGGAGGTCVALLHCATKFVSIFPAPYLTRTTGADEYDFVSVIATLPGGAVLTYGAIGDGAENTIKPASANHLAKLRLYNSTRGTYGLIDSVDTGTNTITLTAAVPGDWVVADTITGRSATTVYDAPPPYFYEFDLSSADNTIVPILTRSIEVEIELLDTGGANERAFLHPWQTYSGAKNRLASTYVASVLTTRPVNMPLYQRRFCLFGEASGAGTTTVGTKINGYWVAKP